MNNQLRADICDYPEVFWLDEPLDEMTICAAEEMWHPPKDLLELWREFGTGLIFESEWILRPFAESSSVEYVTEREKRKGLREDLMLFHYGLFASAFSPGGIDVFEPDSYKHISRFNTLDGWYTSVLRDHFGARYGLK